MKNFALKSYRFRSGFVGSLFVAILFVAICCLGISNIGNAETSKGENSKDENSRFDTLESKYVSAQNDYKTNLNNIEAILEKTKTIKTRADNAKNKTIAAVKKKT